MDEYYRKQLWIGVKVVTSFVAVVALVIGMAVWVCWEEARIQADVYRRQGVEISQYEVFRGARPIHMTKGNQ